MRPWAIVALGLAAAGCAKKPRGIAIEVTTGHETGIYALDPQVGSVTVVARDAGGNPVGSATAAPGGDFSLGEFQLSDFVSLEVTGTDAAGNVRIRGRSMGVELDNFAGDVLPVFAERVGAWARPPNQLPETHVRGVVGAVAERGLLLTGGDGAVATKGTFYDLLSWGPTGSITLPRAASTVVVAQTGTAFLLIGPSTAGGSDIGATWVDFASTSSSPFSEAALPQGLTSFADVAGGQVIVNLAKKDSYVVGPTRLGSESDRVLVIAADRTLSAVKLVAKRKGAAATWVDAVGLVVIGGNASADVPGVETLTAGTTAFIARPFPADGVVGAAAVQTHSGDEVALVGGSDGGKPAATRLVSSSCSSKCDADTKTIDPAGLGIASDGCVGFYATGFVLAACNELAPGKASNGQTRFYSLKLAGNVLKELPLKEPRVGAALLPTPLGALALMGGKHVDGTDALTAEMLIPE